MKKLSPLAERKIGWYVYSLQDTKGLFCYIGKGTDSRVYEHRNSMNDSDTRKNIWLRNNEFQEFIHSTHSTSDAAYEAEAMLIELVRRRPMLGIPDGLLNDVSGHHGICMKAERYDKLHGDQGEFDKEKVDKLFRKQDRCGVILNIMRSADINKRNNTSYREMAFGYTNACKERLHLTEEIFIRFKGSIVEHWTNVKWTADPYKGSVWSGTKMDSEYAPTAITCKIRKSQASAIYINMDWDYKNKKRKKHGIQ
jgi:hypothetical protein